MPDRRRPFGQGLALAAARPRRPGPFDAAQDRPVPGAIARQERRAMERAGPADGWAPERARGDGGLLAPARPHLDRCSADPQAAETLAIQRDWQAHVDAGRIGVSAAEPTAPGDTRCATLARILGARP